MQARIVRPARLPLPSWRPAASTPALPDGARYAHATWADVAPLIADVWGDSTVDWERKIAERLAWWLTEVEAQRPLPPRERSPVPPQPEAPVESVLENALQQAAAVQRTGQQGVVDQWPGSPDLLDELRLEVRARLRDGVVVDATSITHVLPWLWSAATSGGVALSDTGRTHGYELRLSRYDKALW
jgi:hypothetical protein